MRVPPILYVTLGPSRLAGACIGIATLATLSIVLMLPLVPWQHAAVCAVVLAWSWVTFERIAARRTPDAVIEVRVAHDLLIVVTRRDGRLLAGRVQPSTCVSAALTGIVWRRSGAFLSRTILVLPDMLPPEDFRRLRVMLRYARSGLAQDAPASHA
ncbi:MAG: protein YgfX [Burkholderiales bacterium]